MPIAFQELAGSPRVRILESGKVTAQRDFKVAWNTAEGVDDQQSLELEKAAANGKEERRAAAEADVVVALCHHRHAVILVADGGADRRAGRRRRRLLQ